jgi:hypothetical protein
MKKSRLFGCIAVMGALVLWVSSLQSGDSIAQTAVDEVVAVEEDILLVNKKLGCEATAARAYAEALQRLAQNDSLSPDQKRTARECHREVFQTSIDCCHADPGVECAKVPACEEVIIELPPK